MGQLRPLFRLFSVFSNKQCNIYNKLMQKCPSSIRRQDSNPWPLELELSAITTRPGLLPWLFLFCISTCDQITLNFVTPQIVLMRSEWMELNEMVDSDCGMNKFVKNVWHLSLEPIVGIFLIRIIDHRVWSLSTPFGFIFVLCMTILVPWESKEKPLCHEPRPRINRLHMPHFFVLLFMLFSKAAFESYKFEREIQIQCNGSNSLAASLQVKLLGFQRKMLFI